MPDKDYIKKVYNFMDSAYGAKGVLSPGAFRGSFDDFYTKISSDSKYADKVQKALEIAYGPNGAVKKGSFSSDVNSFQTKVLKQPEQFKTAQDLLTFSGQYPKGEDPTKAVLASGQSLEAPVAEEPKYLQDIKAFEPDIKAKEGKDKAEQIEGGQLAEKYLMREMPQQVSMTPVSGKEAVDQQIQDPNIQYHNSLNAALDKIKEEDNNRLSTQAAADALYQTPEGRFYYDFVRPVYKTAVETGKNVAGFGARLFNADKTADNLVNYFDFDRLAREGNPTAALNMEPTKQQGKLGINNIIPKTVEALTNMGMLMGGASILGGGKAALFASSFATQYEDYRKSGKQAGLSDADADKYAITGAGLNSMLELVSPNEAILKGTQSTLAKKGIIDAIKNGVSVKTAFKTGLKDGLKEIGKENAQELSQSIGDNAVKYAYDNYILKDPRFHQENIIPTSREMLETVVLTSLATGIMSAPHLVAKNKVPSLERSAWATAAQNPQIIEDGLQKAVASQQITQEKADQIRQNVGEYKQIYDALSAKGYDPEAVERMAINAFRSQKIDQQNKPIAGIPALNAITAQDEGAKAEIEKEVLSAAAGEPETGYDQAQEEQAPQPEVGINVQRPGDINRPQVTTIGSENTNQPLNTEQNAVPVESPAEMDVRQQTENGEGMGEGNAQPEIVTQESEQTQEPQRPEDEIATPQQQSAPSMVPEEIKARRDTAIDRLKNAWDAYKTVGIISDPENNLKRDKEFYSALANYVKEELLYRSSQIKGFAKQKKAQIKRAIMSSLKQEGIGLQDISMLNGAFEDAYKVVRGIPGVLPSEMNDRVSFKQYIKDRIKVREAGYRKGTSDGKAKGMAIGKEQGKQAGLNRGIRHGAIAARGRVGLVKSAINETLRGSGVKIGLPQLRTISSLLQKATTAKDMDKSLQTAIDRSAQIVWEAKNRQKISQARGLIKSLSKLKKSKSMVLQDKEWIKSLNLPSPAKVDDLDTYIEMLQDFTQSRKGNELAQQYSKEAISEFIDQENDRIYKEKRAAQQEDLDDLIEQGIIPEDVKLDEYLALLDNTEQKSNEGINKKAEVLRNSLKEKLIMLKDRLAEFDGDDKRLVRELSEVDPAYLNPIDLIRLNNVLNNIAEFGTLDSAGDIVTSFKAKKVNVELAASKEKIRELPSLKVLDRKNLSNFMSALFYNDNAISNFRSKTIGPIEKQVSKVKNTAQQVVKEFTALNKRAKTDGLSNNKLHVFSYLNQYRGNEPGEITDDLLRRVDDLVDDAKYIYGEAARIKGPEGKPFKKEAKNRLRALQDLGLIDYTVADGKLTVDVKDNFQGDDPVNSLSEIENRLTTGEKEIYKFAREHYDELSDKLEDVTRNYAGKVFQRERNYISLVPRRKRVADLKEPDLTADTDILTGLRSVNAKPSSTTIKRSETKPKDIYYDSDFFSNFINRYYTSLYTAEVLPELQTVAKTVNDPSFEKFLTGQFDESFAKTGKENYQKFKAKLAEAVNEEKYSPFFKRGKTSVLDEVVNKGVRLVLGNVWQGPKQYIPALIHSFSINDHKAIAYALASRGKALSGNKEYAQARQDLLNHFTGVQRSTVGSNAYDKYIKRIDDDIAWWQHPNEWLENVRKLSSFVLEKADHAAQNDAYISSYITSLLREKKIKSIKDFDIYEAAKNPDKKALAYAEQIASNINNESAKAYRPAVLKDTDKARNLWLLQGFALNAYQNAMNKAKIMFDNRANTAEKKEAAFHFLGYLGELSAYQLVGKWARNLQGALAMALLSALFNVKSDDDENLEKKKKENIKMVANMSADLAMSGLPAPYQTAAKMSINYAYNQWAKIKAKQLKETAKAEGRKFDPRGTYLSPYFKPFVGAEGPGGAAEFYTSLSQKAVDAVVKSANSGTNDTEETETQKLMSNLNKYLGIPAAIIGSGDLMIINNKMQQALREKASAEKKEASSGTGHSRAHRSRRSANRTRHNR